MKKLLITTLFLVSLFGLQQKAEATAYYIDCVGGNNGNPGTATTSAWADLDQFTENARTGGDIAFVRRGGTGCDNGTDLTFTSDGSVVNPIIISADYDNLWSDFATSSQTYTMAVGSTTMTASAAQSDIVVGEWIYVEGDCGETYSATSLNRCEFAYEVSAVASTSISFYLPYKGNNAGSGKYLRIMPSAPLWNTAAGDFQWIFGTDNFWKILGIDIRGTDANGQVRPTDSWGLSFMDSIFVGNGSFDMAFNFGGSSPVALEVRKSRSSNNRQQFLYTGSGDNYGYIKVSDVYTNNVSGSAFMYIALDSFFNVYLENIVAVNDAYGVRITNSANVSNVYTRNARLSGSTAVVTVGSGNPSQISSVMNEDFLGVVGDNRQFLGVATDNTDSLQVISTSTAIRTGGGSTSIKIEPTTNLSPIANWEFSRIKLFEYPIYANTVSRQYDVYFMSTSTSAWTADPTTDELWIECEYWDYPANGTSNRKITRSTGTLNFTGSTDWQNLSVTCQPSTSGVLYLRGYYAKTKESGKMNELFVDTTPVISTP